MLSASGISQRRALPPSGGRVVLGLALLLTTTGLPAEEGSAPGADEALDALRLAPGDTTTTILPAGSGRVPLRIHSEGDGLLLLRVQAEGTQPVDLSLRFNGLRVDQDPGSDYRQEGLLLNAGGDHEVVVERLDPPSTSIPLRISVETAAYTTLRPGEALSLPPDAGSAAYFALHVPDQEKPGTARRSFEFLASSADANLALTILQPDGTLAMIDNGERGMEHYSLARAAPGRYFVQVRHIARTDTPAGAIVTVRFQEHGPRPREIEPPHDVTQSPEEPADALPSRAHLPVVPGPELVVGERPVQGRLDREHPRMFHRVVVEENRPVLVEVRDPVNDLIVLVKGPFEYRADFDAGKEPGREFVVLPFAGEYEILIQRPDTADDAVTAQYTVRTTGIEARQLKANEPITRTLRLHEAGAYRFEVGYNFPITLTLRGTAEADLFMTVYIKKSDGRLMVRNIDSDEDGLTASEEYRIEESGEVFVVIRQGAGRLASIPYEVQFTENPVLSRP